MKALSRAENERDGLSSETEWWLAARGRACSLQLCAQVSRREGEALDNSRCAMCGGTLPYFTFQKVPCTALSTPLTSVRLRAAPAAREQQALRMSVGAKSLRESGSDR